MKQKIQLPFNIYIERNPHFFAQIEWFLYSKFNKKRSIPCGRTKKDRFLCCCQPRLEERCYYNEDHTEIYCKCCNSIRGLSNYPIKTISNPFKF